MSTGRSPVYGVDVGHRVHIAPSYPRPAPARWTVNADLALFQTVTSGHRELLLSANGVEGIQVGDVIHLREHNTEGTPTGRCCYRLITRRKPANSKRMAVTVLPGTGQCNGHPDADA